MKLRAGALPYAIFVAVITAVLCGLMILLAALNRQYFIKMDRQERVMDNARSGVAWGMSLAPGQDFSQWVDLYEEGTDSVFLKKHRWGAYEVVSARAMHHRATYEKSLLYGFHHPSLEHTALWLRDRNRPLQISGDALLKGNCYLPQKGVDRAYIEGRHYAREQLVYGMRRPSIPEGWSLEDGLETYARDLLQKRWSSHDSLIDFAALPASLTQPFQYNTLVAYSQEPLNLGGYRLRGNVLVMSAKSIVVPARCTLEDVLLVAPKIILQEGCRVTAHLVASDSIKIAEQAQMPFPSSIVLVHDGRNAPWLKLEQNSRVAGTVAALAPMEERTNDRLVTMAPRSVLQGLLYCQGNLQLAGRVEGSVIAEKFILATASGIYENHLLDGEIDRSALPQDFAALALNNNEKRALPARWMHYAKN